MQRRSLTPGHKAEAKIQPDAKAKSESGHRSNTKKTGNDDKGRHKAARLSAKQRQKQAKNGTQTVYA